MTNKKSHPVPAKRRKIKVIREVKHDVNDRQQTTKITSDFEFSSSSS